MARRRAVVLVWILGAVPVLIIGGELIVALAQSLTTVIAGEPPTSAQIAGLIERPAALLQSVGLKIDLLPLQPKRLTSSAPRRSWCKGILLALPLVPLRRSAP